MQKRYSGITHSGNEAKGLGLSYFILLKSPGSRVCHFQVLHPWACSRQTTIRVTSDPKKALGCGLTLSTKHCRDIVSISYSYI